MMNRRAFISTAAVCILAMAHNMTDYAATMRDFRLEVPPRFNWAFDTFDGWARDRVRPRPAQDDQRQDPAHRAAPDGADAEQALGPRGETAG